MGSDSVLQVRNRGGLCMDEVGKIFLAHGCSPWIDGGVSLGSENHPDLQAAKDGAKVLSRLHPPFGGILLPSLTLLTDSFPVRMIVLSIIDECLPFTMDELSTS